MSPGICAGTAAKIGDVVVAVAELSTGTGPLTETVAEQGRYLPPWSYTSHEDTGLYPHIRGVVSV